MLKVLRRLCDRAFSAWQRLVAAVAAVAALRGSEPRVESVGDFDFWP